jgi:hypothetical protein
MGKRLFEKGLNEYNSAGGNYMTKTEFKAVVANIGNELDEVVPGRYPGGFEQFQKDYTVRGIDISYKVGDLSHRGEFTISAKDEEGSALSYTITLA